MSIRRKIIEYSRGNDLSMFWRLYRLQKKTADGIMHDILTFLLSRRGCMGFLFQDMHKSETAAGFIRM